MEQEFLNRFYNIQYTVSMTEMTNIKQWKDEPVLDYINCWHALSLECKDKLSEASIVEMCTQGMARELLYVLQMSKPRTFHELATKAHDMEVTIANRRSNPLSFGESKREGTEVKRNVKFSKNSAKETMNVTKAKLVRITGKPNFEKKRSMPFKDTMRRLPTLKELQEKKYPFPDSDLLGMLDDLLKKGVIQLLEPKRPEEVGRTANPKYCLYHRMVSHPLEKCITIKERIMQLAKEGRIILDLDDVVEANHVSSQTRELLTLQFRNLEPVVLCEPWLLSPNMKDKTFPADRTTVNMTSYSELEEEIDEEGVSKENSSGEIDKTMAALETMPICLNWGRIFPLPSETCQHMIIALQHPEIYAEEVKGSLKWQKPHPMFLL